jgi:hypothetical protein
MSNYTPTTNFAAKDSLPSGDPAKTIRGSEFSTEFNELASSIASKANSANPIFSGTVTLDDLNVSGDTTLGGTLEVTGLLTADTIDGGTY